jgi:hypothetical protein
LFLQVSLIAPGLRKEIIYIVSVVASVSKCFAFMRGQESFILVAIKVGILEHKLEECHLVAFWLRA